VHAVPTQPTPFFGRQTEIAELIDCLTNPSCRLVTLAGAGGAGKTRLALEVGTRLRSRFAHGVCFVPVPAQVSPTLPAPAAAVTVAAAVTDTLQVPLLDSADPAAQLVAHLSGKELFLILDNYEHLLTTGGAELAARLLAELPKLKLLVTSREALNLQEEWLYPLRGMSLPAGEDFAEVERSSVVQLFAERANRAKSRFSLADEYASVSQICRLVEGMPLAIELAAQWTSTMTCASIADELARNLRFLHSSLRDVPDRHRSIQAVFDQSWALLSVQERDTMQRLSVFRGGFEPLAAEAVAGASLQLLAVLARKSLLDCSAGGRCRMPELLRQYAEEQLVRSPAGAAEEARNRHCVHYSSLMRERSAGLNGGRQLQAVEEIAVEIQNIRAAWQWAVQQCNIAALIDAANALYIFCQYRGRYVEGADLFAQAVQCVDDAALAALPRAAILFYHLSWLHIRLGRLEEAQVLFQRCVALQHDICRPDGLDRSCEPLLGLGLLASLRGDYAAAQQLMQLALRNAKLSQHHGNRRNAHLFLAGIFLAQGEYVSAQNHAEAAHSLALEAGDRWLSGYCLNELGNTAVALGRYDEAHRYYSAAYTLKEEFGDPEGMALCLAYLGNAAQLQSDANAAEALHRRSLEIYRTIDDQGGLVTALNGLAQAVAARGDAPSAARYWQQALLSATKARLIAATLSLLLPIGQFLLRQGREDLGRKVLVCVLLHASTPYTSREHARQVLELHAGTPSPDDGAETDYEPALETVAASVQVELAALAVQPSPGVAVRRLPNPSVQPLVEPLTPRELEILRLLAAGRSYEQIATGLIIALGSVKSHAHNIYGKLGVRNRVQAAARAAELGLL
jgi:predicted ATPase/DNA-binding CsgD family transcriptional regulator/Tfp pilus assembly protein PilF